MPKTGWYEDMIADLNDKHEQEQADRENDPEAFRDRGDPSELDDDGCYPDGSRDDEPGPGMG